MQKIKLALFSLAGLFITFNLSWSQSINLEKNYYKRVSSKEAYEIIKSIKNNPEIVILDVRTEKEFKSGYIENAKNLDFYASNFKEELNKLDRNKTYLVFCRSGNRSGQTLDIMKNLGFKKAINIGGIIEWLDAGLPLIK